MQASTKLPRSVSTPLRTRTCRHVVFSWARTVAPGLKTLAPDRAPARLARKTRPSERLITRPSGTESRASRRPGLARDRFVPRIRRVVPVRRRCRDRPAPGQWGSPEEWWAGRSAARRGYPGAHGTAGPPSRLDSRLPVGAVAAPQAGLRVAA